MSAMYSTSGGLSVNLIPQEAAKQLLGEKLLGDIECQSKTMDVGIMESRVYISSSSNVDSFGSLYRASQHYNNMVGRLIYKGILGKYFRTNRINQQLAEAVPNKSSMPGGWIEYRYNYQDDSCDDEMYEYDEEREGLIENYGQSEAWYDTILNDQHQQHEFKESRNGSSVREYSNKIAESFWSINRSTTSRTSSLENNIGGIPNEVERVAVLEDPIVKCLQLNEQKLQRGYASPTRVVRGGPPDEQRLIVRVSTHQSPQDLSTFSLSQFKASLESSDARTSLKHIPPKTVQALNLKQSIKQRLARQSTCYRDFNRCCVRVNAGGSNAEVFAALADTQAKNHRGSKGPRPQIYGEELDTNSFLLASQSSYRNLNNPQKLRNEVDYHGNIKSNNFAKHGRARRARPRKQSQQQ